MPDTSRREIAAVIGCGVIGAGWIARLRLRGVDVHAYDPSPSAARVIGDVHDRAATAWRDLGLAPDSSCLGRLTICPTLHDAVADQEVGFVVECVPEQLNLKHTTLAAIDQSAPTGAIVTSSTSGFTPSVLAEPMQRPGRFVVAHPFNPVYLLPLVEIVAGEQTESATTERVMSTMRDLGMHPVLVRAEIDAHIADRLLEAVWREALWLVNDGVATTAEIDETITYGFGLRWAQMGLFETYRIAGGEGGMGHFIAQFGEALTWPWTKLMDTPPLTEALIARIAAQSDEQSGHHPPGELERIRDRNLVAILRALEANDWGAGRTIAVLRAG